MRHRHVISDDDWTRIKDLLPGLPGQHGKVTKDHRLFVDAVLWIARTGAPWRDLPKRFGNWNSTWRRFERWVRKGVWRRVSEALQDPDLDWLILDSTIIRAHPCAAAAKKVAASPSEGCASRSGRPSASAVLDGQPGRNTDSSADSRRHALSSRVCLWTSGLGFLAMSAPLPSSEDRPWVRHVRRSRYRSKARVGIRRMAIRAAVCPATARPGPACRTGIGSDPYIHCAEVER